MATIGRIAAGIRWYSRLGCPRPAPVVVAAMILGGCAVDPGPGIGPPDPVSEPAAFDERIEGTPVSLRLVPIPAGRATVRGADGSTREVGVGPFWIGATEVTWELYDLFVFGLDRREALPGGADAVTRPSKPYLPPDRGFGHDGFPAMSMSYTGATEFCRWLTIKTGRTYRLPTEPEWEHAARGPVDSGSVPLEACAWFAGNAGGTTHAVGTKQPNGWGVFDALGNVAEWCPGLDGKPVTKGGSYRDPPGTVTIEARVAPTPAWNASDPQMPKSRWWLADGPFVGFRVVCEGPPPTTRPVEPNAGARR